MTEELKECEICGLVYIKEFLNNAFEMSFDNDKTKSNIMICKDCEDKLKRGEGVSRNITAMQIVN